jgi:hypothetical protein
VALACARISSSAGDHGALIYPAVSPPCGPQKSSGLRRCDAASSHKFDLRGALKQLFACAWQLPEIVAHRQDAECLELGLPVALAGVAAIEIGAVAQEVN